MSKEPSVVIERRHFLSRESRKDPNYHHDLYHVTQIDSRSGTVVWQGQQTCRVLKRVGKTRTDKRSGSYGNRFVNRQQDPSRVKGGS